MIKNAETSLKVIIFSGENRKQHLTVQHQIEISHSHCLQVQLFGYLTRNTFSVVTGNRNTDCIISPALSSYGLDVFVHQYNKLIGTLEAQQQVDRNKNI